jgi:hypothetical protein
VIRFLLLHRIADSDAHQGLMLVGAVLCACLALVVEAM